jgi:PAS domain S-box-containing protein
VSINVHPSIAATRFSITDKSLTVILIEQIQVGLERGRTMTTPGQKSILLVEDEVLIALDEAQTMEGFGYRVISTASGEDAIEILEQGGNVDLVLMDIDLGRGIEGTEAARRILAKWNVPVVFLTSHAEQEMVEKVRGLTRYGYVIKESGDFVLRSSIEMALELFNAHENMRMGEARLRTLLQTIPDLVWLKDGAGVYLACNGMFEKLYGAREADIIGKTDYDFVSREQADFFREHDRKAIERGRPSLNEEWLTFAEDGHVALAETIKTPMFGEDGRLIGVLGIARDITERKRIEREMARMNRALRMLSDANQALIRYTDEAALLQEVCRIAVEVGGHRLAWVGFAEPDEAKTLRPVAHAGFNSGYIESAKVTWADNERGRGPGGTAIRTGQPCIARNILVDPAFVPWREAAIRHGYQSIIALPVICENRTYGALGIYSAEIDAFDEREVELLKELAADLAFGIAALRMRAERQRAEALLRESEERYRLIAENTADTIAVMDLDLKPIYVSPSVFKLRGYSAQEAMAQSLDQMLPPESLKKVKAQLAEQMVMEASGKADPARTARLELEEYCRNGDTVWVELAASFIRDGNFRPTGILTVSRDITARKRAEEERLVHLRFFENMDKINLAMQKAHDLEQMMNEVLGTALSIFDADRAWLLYPCEPEAPSFRVPMEVTKPEYPGAKVLNVDVPMSPGEARTMREALSSDVPVTYTAGTERPVATAKQFGVQSQMFVPVYPKSGKPWMFGLHQCSYPRIWTPGEKTLFREIGRRLSDALTGLLILRDLKERPKP